MKILIDTGAQGDLLMLRVNSLPKIVTRIEPENGSFIIAHSETGHHHIIEAKDGVSLFKTNDFMEKYLHVIDNVEVTLEHLRSFDTHESWLLKGGTYRILRSRELREEGWGMVTD